MSKANAELIIGQLRGLGYLIYPAGELVMVRRLFGGTLTEAQCSSLRANKPDVLRLLRVGAFRARIREVVADIACWYRLRPMSIEICAMESELDRLALNVEEDLDSAIRMLDRWHGAYKELCTRPPVQHEMKGD